MECTNYITSLGNIFGTGEVFSDLGGYFFTIICVVGVINAFNMIDGIDGLAGGMSLVILLTVAGFLILLVTELPLWAAYVVAAIVPFLAFSWGGRV